MTAPQAAPLASVSSRMDVCCSRGPRASLSHFRKFCSSRRSALVSSDKRMSLSPVLAAVAIVACKERRKIDTGGTASARDCSLPVRLCTASSGRDGAVRAECRSARIAASFSDGIKNHWRCVSMPKPRRRKMMSGIRFDFGMATK